MEDKYQMEMKSKNLQQYELKSKSNYNSSKKKKDNFIIKDKSNNKNNKIQKVLHLIKKDIINQSKNKENKNFHIPMTFNEVGEFDNESLEVKLNYYESKLKKERKNQESLVKKLNHIKDEINDYEKIIEDNKFLFQKKESENNVIKKKDNDEICDNHTQSLLKMMKKKHKALEDKLGDKEKEYKELQKGYEFTELVELLSEIEELKKEIENLENLPEDFYVDFEEKENNEVKNKKEIREHKNTSKSVFQNYFGDKNEKKDIFTKKHLKSKKNKSLKNDQKEEKEIFLINHLILENLKEENRKLYDELMFLTNDNLNLEKTNSSIEETIKLQTITLDKLKTEYKQKLECCSILQNKENIKKFSDHESILKSKLK